MKLFLVKTSKGDVYALGEDDFGDEASDKAKEWLKKRHHGGSAGYVISVDEIADSETDGSVSKLLK